MGIRPRGLGLRLKSRQFHPEVPIVGGARWPLGVIAPRSGSSSGVAPSGCTFLEAREGLLLLGARLLDLRVFLVGLRDLVRALLLLSPRSSVVSDSDTSSMFSCIIAAGPVDDDAPTPAAAWRRFAADRVTGPRYESGGSSSSSSSSRRRRRWRSEGVGLGEMTRGVAGTTGFPRTDIAR